MQRPGEDWVLIAIHYWPHTVQWVIPLSFLGYILGIYSAGHGNILGITLAYHCHILGIIWVYLGHILGMSLSYLGHIVGIRSQYKVGMLPIGLPHEVCDEI